MLDFTFKESRTSKYKQNIETNKHLKEIRTFNIKYTRKGESYTSVPVEPQHKNYVTYVHVFE